MFQRLQSLILAAATVGVAVLVYLAEQPKDPVAYVTQRPLPIAATSPTPSRPSSLWVGDAFTAGAGATNQAHAESCLAAKAMGWACHVDAQSGTGYLSTGQANSPAFAPLGQRLKVDTHRYTPDVVILDAGRTDAAYPLTAVDPAVKRAAKSIHTGWPQAQLVFIAPYFMTSDTAPLGTAFVTFLHTVATKYHGVVIDPIGEGWISNAKTGAMTTAGQVYPSPAGHRYIARHLAADFTKIPKLADLAAAAPATG